MTQKYARDNQRTSENGDGDFLMSDVIAGNDLLIARPHISSNISYFSQFSQVLSVPEIKQGLYSLQTKQTLLALAMLRELMNCHNAGKAEKRVGLPDMS